MFTNMFKISKTVDFHDYIYDQYDNGIHISTNMPGIGSIIHETDVKILKLYKIKNVC